MPSDIFHEALHFVFGLLVVFETDTDIETDFLNALSLNLADGISDLLIGSQQD